MDNEAQNTRWRVALAVHLEDIGVQHRRLTALADELTTAIAAGASEKAIASRFSDLLSYFELHLSDEEEFMKRGGYPEALLLEHARAHQQALDRLRSIRHRQGGGTIHIEPVDIAWLTDWFHSHEENYDERYLDHFRKNKAI